MKFVSVHHHSTFSYLDGYGTPEQHVARVAELGMDSLALTEHGNVSSHVRLEKAAKAQGIKPMFGCELYTGSVDDENRTRRKNHLTVIAKDQTGYQNLLRMVSRGWDEGFYFEPTVSGKILRDHAEGTIVTSGCTASLAATSLLGGKNVDPADASEQRARKVVANFRDFFGEDYFLEVQAIPELADVCAINQTYEKLSRELGVPLVATCDVHYTKPDESELRKILHGQRPSAKGKNKDIEQIGQEFDYSIDASPPLTDRIIYQRLRDTGLSHEAAREAVLNTRRIAEKCDVTLPRIKPLTYPLPDGVPDSATLYRKWLNDGWRHRGFDSLSRREKERYIERVKYENKLIESKDFVDYFLVLSDAVKYAKRNGIAVGPARGSAAASLACYLLQITEVNPMNHPTLVFERFIDQTRVDLPDIDLDFDDARRHEVHEYLVQKYGEDRVGTIGTFTQYKGKNSLDDVARVYRIPSFEVERVKELLLERSSGDLRASATIEDTVEMFDQAREVFDKYPSLYIAQHLEGNVRGMSVHAAGLVVANEPLTNACAVYARRDKHGNKTEVLSVDKYDADYLNVLKIDVLGLKTMGLIGLALDMIGMTLDEMYRLPLNDKEVLRGFRENDVVGIFQFDGRATRSVNGSLVPDSFEEICDINALSRPGPLHSGATAEYIDVKYGRKEAVHYHPIVDDITKHTQYQVVYQEQILRIVRELGGFDWEEAARIRKIISKKRGEQEFNQQRQKFIEGAAKHGMEEDDADAVWRMLATAGAYAFNAAHCEIGGTVLPRPGKRDVTFEELYSAVNLWKSRKGGRYAEAFQGPCNACGQRDPRDSYVQEQCWKCYNIRNKYNSGQFKVLSYDPTNGRVTWNTVKEVFYNGTQEVFRVTWSTGETNTATGDHRFLTPEGWCSIDELEVGDDILYCPFKKDGPQWKYEYRSHGNYLKKKQNRTGHERCEWCDSDKFVEISHVDEDHDNDDDSNLIWLCRSCHMNHDNPRIPWSHGGYFTDTRSVSNIEYVGREDVYTLEMDGNISHTYVTQDGAISKNCVSYGTLAWWTMWLKRYHPTAFYAAALQKYEGEKRDQLLRDAAKKDLEIRSPDLHLSGETWKREGQALRMGLTQIPGIGEKMAHTLIDYRDEVGVDSWDDFTKIKGVGPKTIEKIRDFVNDEDPFNLELLRNTLQKVRKQLENGEIEDEEGVPLPAPTHGSLDVPYDRGKDEQIVWLGVVRERNYKDLFELHHSRTGEHLDENEVRDPHLVNWLVMLGEDDQDYLTVTVDRWKWPSFENICWDLRLNRDLVLVHGVKKGFQSRRAIYVERMWVFDPD